MKQKFPNSRREFSASLMPLHRVLRILKANYSTYAIWLSVVYLWSTDLYFFHLVFFPLSLLSLHLSKIHVNSCTLSEFM